MAGDNPVWGEERIANELLLKLGLRVSPRTVRKYMPKHFDRGQNHGILSQRWQTFVRNHAQAIVACDFCAVVKATFRLLYIFVVMEHATRQILHCHVTAHPTAQWTLQQLREAISSDHSYRFLIHDRDCIFSQQLDQQVQHLGLRVLKTPVRSPQANAFCERLLGTLQRECLDFLIPLTGHYLRRLLHEWATHYNTGRPHMSLGQGIPQTPASLEEAWCRRSMSKPAIQPFQHLDLDPAVGHAGWNVRSMHFQQAPWRLDIPRENALGPRRVERFGSHGTIEKRLAISSP
jgi:putative transposase